MTLFEEPSPEPGHPPVPVPSEPTLQALRKAAAGCQACDLYRNATQTVFGEGEEGAPNAEEIGACRPWLEREIEVVGPELIACLGATAAQALLGPKFRVTKERGQVRDLAIAGRTLRVTATVHPSSILRAPDEQAREGEYERFVADLGAVAGALRG